MFYLFKPAPGIADQALAVSSSAVSAATLGYPECTHVRIQVQGADVRVTFNGTAPVGGTNGFEYPALTSEIWSHATLRAARFIRNASTDAVVFIQPLVFA